MKRNSELRAEARQALECNWGDTVFMVFVLFVIETIVITAFLISGAIIFGEPYGFTLCVLSPIMCLPFTYSAIVAFLRLKRGNNISVKDLFTSYNIRILGTMLLRLLNEILWSLLFIIPGIIKSYSYIMTEYIMADDPEIKYNAAIEKSMEMMKGKKMKLFLLDFSFIGWAILCLLTMGLGFIILVPYIYTSHAAFYEALKEELYQSKKQSKYVK